MRIAGVVFPCFSIVDALLWEECLYTLVLGNFSALNRVIELQTKQ